MHNFIKAVRAANGESSEESFMPKPHEFRAEHCDSTQVSTLLVSCYSKNIFE